MQFIKDFVPELIVQSPGRINLIGEHTDYNLGFVLPAAIAHKIIFKFRKNDSLSLCNVYSLSHDVGFTLDLNRISKSKTEWENYILGVLNEISKHTDKLQGFDCTIESDLPEGSGLSSSAALECGLAFGLNELFHLNFDKRTIIELSQLAEHTYVGTQCGIMDQFACVMGRENHVIFLDCQSLEHNYIPFDIRPYKILMLNTKVSHNLATSEYNKRKEECQEGVIKIRQRFPEVDSLREVTSKILKSTKHSIDQKIYNRCSFVVEENKRVMMAVKALKENNIDLLGQLLYESHFGLSSLYEVSCPESDFLVDFSREHSQAVGARQMGGGFGGCILNLIHEDFFEDFKDECLRAYQKEFGKHLTPFEVFIGEGTRIVH